jgi:hypothetical protein
MRVPASVSIGAVVLVLEVVTDTWRLAFSQLREVAGVCPTVLVNAVIPIVASPALFELVADSTSGFFLPSVSFSATARGSAVLTAVTAVTTHTGCLSLSLCRLLNRRCNRLVMRKRAILYGAGTLEEKATNSISVNVSLYFPPRTATRIAAGGFHLSV